MRSTGTMRIQLLTIFLPAALVATEPPRPVSCDAAEQTEFRVGGVTSMILRRVAGPNGAVDLRILGSHSQPAILSLIGPDRHRYADYTYDGFNADLDVGHGGLN